MILVVYKHCVYVLEQHACWAHVHLASTALHCIVLQDCKIVLYLHCIVLQDHRCRKGGWGWGGWSPPNILGLILADI